MKNRLSTFLMVLLTALMVTCSGCPDKEPDAAVVSGTWTVVSVTSSLGASAVQPKFGAAVGGTFEIGAAYTLKTPAPASAVTPGGTGAAVVTSSTPTTGNVVLDAKVTLAYSNLTATDVTLSGDVTAGTGKSTQNVHTIVLKRQ